MPISRPWGNVGRVVDLAASTFAVVFFIPILVIASLAILLMDGGPIFDRQERIGRGGRRFQRLTFRTTVVDVEARRAAKSARGVWPGLEWTQRHRRPSDPRINPVGEFLRTAGLDGLPQLFNVLCGDMSLVGPRPIAGSEIGRYGIHFRHYCAVRPGLTGLWQIDERDDVSYRDQVVRDVAYVRAKCVTLDLKILLASLPALVMRRES